MSAAAVPVSNLAGALVRAALSAIAAVALQQLLPLAHPAPSLSWRLLLASSVAPPSPALCDDRIPSFPAASVRAAWLPFLLLCFPTAAYFESTVSFPASHARHL